MQTLDNTLYYALLESDLIITNRGIERVRQAILSASRNSLDMGFSNIVVTVIVEALRNGDIDHVDNIYDIIEEYI